jgi:RNA polymerase sigma factor (sigma-70 family)
MFNHIWRINGYTEVCMLHDSTRDRVYTQYYNEVGKHQVLTAAEERELLRRYYTCPNCTHLFEPKAFVSNCPTCGEPTPEESRDKATACTRCGDKFEISAPPVYCPKCGSSRDLLAREKIIQANLRFVIRRAKKITQDSEHFQKLVSAGNVGLVIALDKFSMNRSTRFLTYAEWWIRKEMLDEIHASHLVHIPTHRQRDLRKSYKEGRYVCTICGLRSETPEACDASLPCTSPGGHNFEAPLNDDAAIMHPAVQVDDTHISTVGTAEDTAISDDASFMVRQTLRRVCKSKRDLYIVLGYFNIPEEERKNANKTLPQLAAITQITPERVRQIKEKAVKMLKREMKRRSRHGDSLGY